VLDTQELMEDPHLRARGMFTDIDHATRGKMSMPGWPVKMSDSTVPVTAAPLLGEQTAEVLVDWLGMDEAQIAEYAKANRPVA
jgi:formyl-CoA transferase